VRKDTQPRAYSAVGTMSASGQKQTCAVKKGMSALPPDNDRESGFPHKGHVCFTPESGHVQCTSSSLLWAKSRHRDDYERSESNAATRGKITLISVNSPGSVSTSIEPPCCFTMMS
jgi:hypothetical protein